MAEKYLRSRGVTMPSPKPQWLRFAPKLTHPNEQYFPALIALVTDAKTGAEMGVQRTFLSWKGTTKAEVERSQQKLSLGPTKGGVVRLAEPIDDKPLLLGEGVETTLTAMLASGLPGWGTLGTAALANIDLPEAVRAVIILAENDGGPNEKALAKVFPLLAERGVSVRVARPPAGLKDFNDLVNGTSGHTPEAGLALVKEAVDSAREFGATDKPESTLKARAPKEHSQASVLVDLAVEKCELFHDAYGEAYSTFLVAHADGAHYETHKLKSQSFQLWLRFAYYKDACRAASSDAMGAAIATLTAKARFDGKTREVFVRRAAVDGKVYLDLCDERWRVVEINNAGWRVIDNPPVRFRRAPGMLPLPEPKRGSPKEGLERLRALLWIKSEEDFVVIVGWLLAALAGRSPYTILFLLGEPGATKTTTARVLRMHIDPNSAPSRGPPREPRGLYIAANRGCVVVCNNVSFLADWLSDELCVITEGSGDAQRELYTDEDESVIYACAPAFVTAIENVIMRGDAVQRTLYAWLEHVPDAARKDEADFFEDVEKARPTILGALCAGVSEGLRRERQLKLAGLPRMAAFAKWGAACETAFWPEGTFMRAYRANLASAVDDVIEADKAVSALRRFMADRKEWKGTATELLVAIEDHVKHPERDAEAAHAKEEGHPRKQVRSAARLREAREHVRETLGKGWPTAAHTLSGRLKRASDALRRTGVHIVWPSRHGDEKRITISNTCPPSLRNEASQASQAPQTKGTSNDVYGLDDEGRDASRAVRNAPGRSAEVEASPEKASRAKGDASFSEGRDAWDASLSASTCGEPAPTDEEMLWRGLA
jgi:hypothetical protein